MEVTETKKGVIIYTKVDAAHAKTRRDLRTTRRSRSQTNQRRNESDQENDPKSDGSYGVVLDDENPAEEQEMHIDGAARTEEDQVSVNTHKERTAPRLSQPEKESLNEVAKSAEFDIILKQEKVGESMRYSHCEETRD